MILISTARLALIAFGLTLSVGCANSPRAKSTAAVGSVSVVKLELERGATQLDTTIASLRDLVDQPASDLRPQFYNYRNQVEQLERASRTLASRNQSMKARTQVYFDAWEKNASAIKTPAVREISVERRLAARESFAKLTAAYATGRSTYIPLIDQLKDIELYLSHDLTAAGIAAVKSSAQDVYASADRSKQAFETVSEELTRVESELSAIETPTESGKPATP